MLQPNKQTKQTLVLYHEEGNSHLKPEAWTLLVGSSEYVWSRDVRIKSPFARIPPLFRLPPLLHPYYTLLAPLPWSMRPGSPLERLPQRRRALTSAPPGLPSPAPSPPSAAAATAPAAAVVPAAPALPSMRRPWGDEDLRWG